LVGTAYYGDRVRAACRVVPHAQTDTLSRALFQPYRVMARGPETPMVPIPISMVVVGRVR